jgi:hypothetical protein
MQVVELVKKHIDPKVFWKSSVEEQEKVLRALFNDICQLYGVEGVEFVVDIDSFKYRATGGGCYSPRERKIYLYKISLMTFLHEVAHMLLGNSEKKARLWSHKVFYIAFPNLYLKNVKERKFFHVLPLEEVEAFNECIK